MQLNIQKKKCNLDVVVENFTTMVRYSQQIVVADLVPTVINLDAGICKFTMMVRDFIIMVL
jgi:hypothetical protein